MVNRLAIFSRATIGAVLAMGGLVLVGWALGIRSLIELFGTEVVMNPMTALAFLVAGICLWALAQGHKGPFSYGLAGAVTLLGLLRLLDWGTGIGLHVDRWIFAHRLASLPDSPLSEMAPSTALNILLCGVGLLLYGFETPSGLHPGQCLVLVVGWISVLALIGYTYQVFFYRLAGSLPMSLDAAVGFALFCTGYLSSRPTLGVMGIVCSRTTGGSMARRLLPAAVLVPWGLGAILLLLEQVGYYSKEFAISVFAVASITIFSALLLWNARLIYRVDVERANSEKQLRQIGANLQRSNTDLQQFASVASHDLFEPLRMITSYIQLLQSRHATHLDKQGKEFLSLAEDGAERMEALIQDLLEYSRVEARGRTFESVDCNQVVDRAVANLKVAIEESGATVRHAALPQVLGDAVQLTQVFQNLIGNAIKFRAGKPPLIEVNALRRPNEWLFEVKDNGIGIDPKFYERIFVIFQRLHTRQEYAGTGLGLAICKRIIERHGGRIWVSSVAGAGSSFFFTIASTAPVEGDSGKNKVDPSGKPGRVDEASARALTRAS